MQATRRATPQQPVKAPAAPARPSAPLPLDPALLRHVSGGTEPSAPGKNW